MSIAATSPSTMTRTNVFGEPQLHTDGEILSLAFAPNGSLWSVEDPGVLRHWNTQNGQQLQWHYLSDLETVWCFSPDTRVLLSASDDLSLWDTSAGQVLTALPQPSWVTALACHPGSARVATGHEDGSIRCWDAPRNFEMRNAKCELNNVHLLKAERLEVSALAFSPDGKFLAAAHEDLGITLWDLANGKLVGTLNGHTDRIPALAWHPGGQYLVSAGWDTTARVWDVRTQQTVILLNSHAAQVTAMAFNKDGSLLASADSALCVRVWDFVKKKEVHVLKGPQAEIFCLAFSADGKTLAANGDRVIHLWDAQTGQSMAGSKPRQVCKTSLCLSPDGTRLASNGGGLAPRVFPLQTADCRLQIDNPSQSAICNLQFAFPVHEMAWQPTGALLAGACEKHVRLWHSGSGKVKMDLVGPHDPITSLAYSPDGSLLAGASATGLAVWLWSTVDGEPALLIPDPLDGCTVQTLAFHPRLPLLAVGGIDWLATGGSNGAISLWNFADRHEVATFLGGTLCLAIHPSGERLASTSLDESVCIWDLANIPVGRIGNPSCNSLLAEFNGHDGPVTCLAYSPDGRWLATGGEDHTIRLWNEDGEECGCHEMDSQPSTLAFSKDGQFLYTANANTTCCQLKVADLLHGRVRSGS